MNEDSEENADFWHNRALLFALHATIAHAFGNSDAVQRAEYWAEYCSMRAAFEESISGSVFPGTSVVRDGREHLNSSAPVLGQAAIHSSIYIVGKSTR